MGSRFVLLLVFLFPTLLLGQKNVTDVTKSEITGITLPAGSKQDRRILSTASARTLLEMKAKEISGAITGSAEVLILPVASGGGGVAKVKQLLRDGGYTLADLNGEPGYCTIEKDGKSFIVYVGETKTSTDFYAISVTVQKSPPEVIAAAPAAASKTQ